MFRFRITAEPQPYRLHSCATTDGTKRYNSHAIGRPGLGPAGVDPPRAFLRGGQVEIPTLHQPLALEPL